MSAQFSPKVQPEMSSPSSPPTPKRHKAGRAALGLSCGSCFERLASVSASRGSSVAGPPPDSATGCRNQQLRNRLPLKQLRKKPAAFCSRLLTYTPINQHVMLLQKSKQKGWPKFSAAEITPRKVHPAPLDDWK